MAHIMTDFRQADLDDATRATLEFAVKLTKRPWAMRRADLDALRAHGYDDRDLLDIVQVAAYFNYINRVADALGVDPEDFMTPWQESPASPPMALDKGDPLWYHSSSEVE